jgi:hypothetical protein
MLSAPTAGPFLYAHSTLQNCSSAQKKISALHGTSFEHNQIRFRSNDSKMDSLPMVNYQIQKAKVLTFAVNQETNLCIKYSNEPSWKIMW